MGRIGAGALGLLCAFVLLALPLTVDVDPPALRAWDVALTEAVSGERSPSETGAAVLLHRLGAWPWGALPVAGLLLPLALLRRWASVLLVASAWAATSLVAVPLAKGVLDRPRPLDRLVVEDTAAYPSGHTAFAAVLVVCAAAVCPERIRVPVLLVGAAFTAVMAWSRMYLGVHWFSDTVGGALLGGGIGLAAWWLRRLASRRSPRDGGVSPGRGGETPPEPDGAAD